jgi:hypothetical protein
MRERRICANYHNKNVNELKRKVSEAIICIWCHMREEIQLEWDVSPVTADIPSKMFLPPLKLLCVRPCCSDVHFLIQLQQTATYLEYFKILYARSVCMCNDAFLRSVGARKNDIEHILV